MGENVRPTKRPGRVAGALYLLSAVAAGVPLVYVSGSLVVDGNAAATGKNVLASEMLFRTCIASELCGAILLLFVARALYALFKSIDEDRASLMVTLVAISVAISFVNALNEFAALAFFKGTIVVPAFDITQRQAMAMFFLQLHGKGVSLANVFWGLWLLPFGVLILKSDALPKILGVLLIVNCFALVCVSSTDLLLPNRIDIVSEFAVVPELGELWVMAWLLLRGANVRKT